MKFWDSSAVIPLLVMEPATRIVTGILVEDRHMHVWWATEVECVSALARLEREDALTETGMTGALERLDLLAESGMRVCVAPMFRSARACARSRARRNSI